MNRKMKFYKLNYILSYHFNFHYAFTSASKFDVFEQQQKQLQP